MYWQYGVKSLNRNFSHGKIWMYGTPRGHDDFFVNIRSREMGEFVNITAEARDRVGKGVARAARREGKVPAVIYGNKQDPLSITLDGKQLSKLLKRPGFFI